MSDPPAAIIAPVPASKTGAPKTVRPVPTPTPIVEAKRFRGAFSEMPCPSDTFLY